MKFLVIKNNHLNLLLAFRKITEKNTQSTIKGVKMGAIELKH